ncbi:methyltransferase [Legionella nautarum]|uniref:Methyltransferase n=1 Tax=Legionella nautarum TaxID=45070 RepID=A0A0W0X314_9GAMM|nr:class I SAM-dependent methyltransferase [Legionella nautarum]KTD38888.1 methyltransferase [Legionella nautarum]
MQNINSVNHSFNNQAENYKHNSQMQWGWANETLKNFSFEPEDVVLDIGCGDGRITALIAEQASEVTGIDYSEKMIAYAREHYPQLSFIHCSATEINYREKFDKVVSFSTMHWVADQQKALQLIKGSLKPGGLLLIVMPGKEVNNLGTVAKKIAKSPQWNSYFPEFKQGASYFSPAEYAVLVEQAGLRVIQIKTAKTTVHFKTKKELMDSIDPVCNFLNHLDSEKRRLFIEELADKWLENDQYCSEEVIAIHHLKIELIAQRTDL